MGALRLRLLTGAALVIGAPLSAPGLAYAAQAQAPAPAPAVQAAPQTAAQTPGADGLTPDAVYMDADSAQR
ncbi:MAG: hypothetical protein B7Z09_03850, partial [Brevundimonas diminuta]